MIRTLLAVCVLIVAAVPVQAGLYFSAVQDFSLAANPNGAWSYGFMDNFATFTPMATTVTTAATVPGNPTDLSAWYDTSIQANFWPHVAKNTTAPSVTATYGGPAPGSVIHPPDMLNLHPGLLGDLGQSVAAVVRWTAPATTLPVYDISWRFAPLDSADPPAAGGTQDFTTVWVSLNGGAAVAGTINTFTAYGQSFFLSFGAVPLPPGTTIDFVVHRNTDGLNDSTGLAVTISQVPEPATLGLVGAGLIGLYWIRRRRKHA